MHVFDANPDGHPRPARPRACSCATTRYDHNYPHCWRTDTPLIYRAVSVVVRAGHRLPRPHGRAEPADQLGARARPRRPVRQVAGGRPRLVDQPQPLLGLADPGVEERRPGATRASTSTASLDELERDFGVRRHRPAPPDASTTSSRPNPDDPTGQLDDAPRRRGARLLVRVGLDALRPGALPVREHASGSSTTTRATSSSSTSARPAAGSTRCTCWPRRCSTGPRSELHGPRHRARRRRPEDVEEPAQLPRPRTRCSTRTAPTRCAGSCCRRRSCAAATSSSTEQGIRDAVRQVVLPIWNAWYFFVALRQRRRAPTARRSAHRPTTGVLDRYILAKTHDLVADGHRRRWTPTTCPAPARRSAAFLDALTNWYIRRSRDRFWAGDAGRLRHAAHGARTCCAASPRRCCRSSPRRSTAASPASAACT